MSSTCRHDFEKLLRRHGSQLGQIFLQVFSYEISYQPLPHDAFQTRANSVDGRPWTQPPDYPKPGIGLLEYGVGSGKHWLLLQWYP
jgi:hypothetical protein